MQLPAHTHPVEADVEFCLSEYEASVLNGALVEFGERWPEEANGAKAVLAQLIPQLPPEWESFLVTPEWESEAT
jgi:hypothetical protein